MNNIQNSSFIMMYYVDEIGFKRELFEKHPSLTVGDLETIMLYIEEYGLV